VISFGNYLATIRQWSALAHREPAARDAALHALPGRAPAFVESRTSRFGDRPEVFGGEKLFGFRHLVVGSLNGCE
jgi:hypothetical protein